MKKFIALVIFLALAVIFIPWLNPAKADQVNMYESQKLVKSVVFKIGVPYYVVDGQTPGVKMDVAPFIQSDRTFVPVRFMGNALGVDDGNIAWDNATQTATLKGVKATLRMTIGKPEVVSNDQSKAIDVAPMLVDPGRTMLPARFVAEGLGHEVDWDEATQTVICWPAGQPKPDVKAAVDWLDGQQQPPVAMFTTRAGYQIPRETKLVIPEDINELGPGGPNDCEMDFDIDLIKGDLESQWNDAAYILSQTLDSQTVSEIMAYAEQKTTRNIELPNKFWNSNGKSAYVGSGWGEQRVTILVWSKIIN